MELIIHNSHNFELNTIEEKLLDLFKGINNECNMHLIFVDSFEIKTLNRKFRKINRVTDCLSFINDFDEDSLGDVFIYYKRAVKQAKEYEHSLLREICFLAVHGYLHLMGYDHMNELDEKKMIEEQNRILDSANIKRG